MTNHKNYRKVRRARVWAIILGVLTLIVGTILLIDAVLESQKITRPLGALLLGMLLVSVLPGALAGLSELTFAAEIYDRDEADSGE